MIQTARLKIRELSWADLGNIHKLHSLPEVDEFNVLGIPETIDTTKEILGEWLGQQTVSPRTSFVFCIELEHTSEFVGLIALTLGKPKFKIGEVWYKIHTMHWRKGYTTEALNGLLTFGFKNLGLHRIEAGCAIENIASYKVMEKVGMIREGSKRKVLPIRGQWFDNYIYAILEDDFIGS